MIKAVIFDMDGVLIDSEPIQSKSFEQVLKTYGAKPIPHKNGLVQTVGITSMDNVKVFKQKYNIKESIASLLNKKRRVYGKLLREELKPKKGLLPLLIRLRRKGLKLAIASSSSPNDIKFVLSGLKIAKYFDKSISGESIRRGKPHPDIFLKTARLLNVAPKFCLVLEDAEAGVLAGKRADMKVIAISNKFTDDRHLAKADLIISSLEKITLEMISDL